MKQSKVLGLFIFLLVLDLLLSPFQTVWAGSVEEDNSQVQKNNSLLAVGGDDSDFSFQNRKEDVIETVKQYFEARYQNFVGLKDIKYIGNFTSTEKSDPSWIELEELRSRTIEKINSSFYLPYDVYEIDLSFSEVTIDGYSAYVFLEENAIVTFKDTTILPLEFSRINHELLLMEDETGWKISNDMYQDIITMQIENRSEKEIFSTIEGNIVNQKRDSEIPSPQPVETPPTNFINLTYNRTAVVNYANTWKNGVNPSFWQESQDCTNFVSQAVYAGTNQVMSTPNDYYNKWYFDSYTKTGSFPWINVGGFYSFLTSNTGRGPVGYSSGSYMCYLSGGDVVVMQYTSGGWRHAVLVTSLTGSCHDYTKIQVASHTPFGSYNLAYFSPSNFFALNITGYNN
ncbi:MAG: amidase domain-containing protein [Anaerolineaceae bacterium]